MGIKADKLRQMADIQERVEDSEEELQELSREIKQWVDKQPIRSNEDIAKDYSQEFGVNLSNARKSLFTTLNKYEIQGNDIPSVIKEMKLYKRTLKGDGKYKFSKAIDNLIEGYSHHLTKMVDDIHWLRKYKKPFRNMTFKENDLIKLSKVTKEDDKREFIDVLCKYWECSIDSRDMGFNVKSAQLSKEMTKAKKQFGQLLKKTLISASPKEEIRKAILKSVCDNPGISSREIHDSLPRNLHNRSSPQIISKLAKNYNITNVDGAYYKFNDDIKKNIWAYTAAFIDSDGYITMDKNHNPRVGLVATGERGKAFMLEMHKSIGFGRLHLDQKSPQNTKLINRLNFYAAEDVKKLLTECKPHFRMKGPNADVLLELIKIKKNDKKKDWYSDRKGELFKLMKYHNHRDTYDFDWGAWDIDIENINKLEENNKMGIQ